MIRIARDGVISTYVITGLFTITFINEQIKITTIVSISVTVCSSEETGSEY